MKHVFTYKGDDLQRTFKLLLALIIIIHPHVPIILGYSHHLGLIFLKDVFLNKQVQQTINPPSFLSGSVKRGSSYEFLKSIMDWDADRNATQRFINRSLCLLKITGFLFLFFVNTQPWQWFCVCVISHWGYNHVFFPCSPGFCYRGASPVDSKWNCSLPSVRMIPRR